LKYQVVFDPAARKQFLRLDRPVQIRLLPHIEALADNPRPAGVVKMAGEENQWRVRVGDWRIIYSIFDRELVVLVMKLGHRREIYR
jgi:mRNA interferase RelE/StbE